MTNRIDDSLKQGSGPIQFSLRSIFVATTLVATLVGAAKWRMGELLPFVSAGWIVIFAIFIVLKNPRKLPTALALVIVAALAVALLAPSTSGKRVSGRRTECLQNLKAIAIALISYHDRYKKLPPLVLRDNNGTAIHSWRTLILPYLEHEHLLQQIDLTKPWDSPKNKPFTDNPISELLCCPSVSRAKRAETNYVAVVGQDTIWDYNKTLPLSAIQDDPHDTILLIEMKNSGIAWAEPRDLDLANLPPGVTMANLLESLSPHNGAINVAFADGHTESIPTTIPVAQLQALFTKSGGDKIDRDSW